MARKLKQIKKKKLEHYEHKGKKRLNNPPVGLVNPQTDQDAPKKKYKYDPHLDPQLNFDIKRSKIEDIIDSGLGAKDLSEAKTALKELKALQQPYLNWAGKVEHTSFEVPTVSLHVHERIDARTIIDAVKKKNSNGQQQSLFSFMEENPPLREAVEFYKHKHNWSNRLIAGDSLLVMNSLLEKEGMSGKVQMVYMDPPYGISYRSNFQPFVSKRDVKEKDEDLTAEPETIKAFRDTWELGLHSYLSYVRDRVLLSKKILSDEGSIFIQIGDENAHHVREVLDEVMGAENFVSMITFKTKLPLGTTNLANLYDYILWYAKDLKKVKFRRLWRGRSIQTDGEMCFVELSSGERRKLSDEEKANINLLSKGSKLFQRMVLSSAGRTESCVFPFEFEGETFNPIRNRSWKTNQQGMNNLKEKNRLFKLGDSLYYVLYYEDFPIIELTNMWDDTTGGYTEPKKYVVQTSPKAIARCMLMCTDPGDLVFDPTCGSGTTAYVAEQWGRRWITCDTSRVAITIAKQRLMTTLFDYYQLAHPQEGVGSGFIFKKAPHVTLGNVAQNEPSVQEILYDQPYIDNSKARITGPFTVEAVPSPTSRSLDELEETNASDVSIARSGETLRQSEWRDELLNNGVRGKGGQYLQFSRVEPMAGTRYIQAEAETKSDKERQRVFIVFGPEYAPMEQRQVALALDEAQSLRPKADIILFAAFQFDPEAAKDIDEMNWPGVTLLRVQMNADLFTEDLKKKRASDDSFWLLGQPDVRVKKIEKGDNKGKFQVEVKGFDYYDTKTGNVVSGGDKNIAVWMLDPDYDGRSLFPRQVFFPMSSDVEGWSKLAKNLKAEIDQELIEAYRGTVSLPFSVGEYKQCAVKIVDDRGIESLRIIKI